MGTRMSMAGWGRRGLASLAALALGATLLAVTPPAAEAEVAAAIRVVSNRADLLSAGDVRVAIDLPADTDPATVTVRLDGEDVSGVFGWRPNGAFEGLLEGVAVDEHELTATVAGTELAPVELAMHPNGGPVFSGPHIQPWTCQPTAEDELCNEPASYDLQYRTTDGRWASYDPDAPPSDVATTTTDQGHEVPFVVRVETGYQDRDQYRIAVLYDPAEQWAAWEPQQAWNHKVLIPHGSSCGIDRQTGSAPDVMDAEALGRGFLVMSTALNHAGHNCNLVTQAESMVMAKERIVERYGDIRYTIGTGCSGGSLTQQQVANAYPGIYQGILPQCSFPDAWSTGQQLVDYHLVRNYVEDPSQWGLGVVWDPVAIAAVEGHPNHVNSIILDTLYWESLGNPTSTCGGVSAEERYHRTDNPGGVRCTLMDYMINVLGPREADRWGPQEQQLGRGFGGVPLDNVGVQYGLEALEAGQITPAQFVDLNAKIGGMDIDTNPTDERYAADQPALRNAYLSGGVNTANNLDQVAIIDLRGPDHGAFHDAYRSWATRARIEREHGHFENHVIWFGHVPLMGDPNWTTEGLVAMDRWLAAVEADDSDAPLAERIVANRPDDIQDRCSQVPGVEQVAVPGIGRVCELEDVQSRYGTPRTVAGSGIETDIQKCQLQPHRRQDYYPVTFTDAQWEALDGVFAAGVCDFHQKGVDHVGTIPWRSYQDGPDGEVVYGGRSLGSAPGGSGEGWTSGAFAEWRQAGEATDSGDTRPGNGHGRDRDKGQGKDAPAPGARPARDQPAPASASGSSSAADWPSVAAVFSRPWRQMAEWFAAVMA